MRGLEMDEEFDWPKLVVTYDPNGPFYAIRPTLGNEDLQPLVEQAAIRLFIRGVLVPPQLPHDSFTLSGVVRYWLGTFRLGYTQEQWDDTELMCDKLTELFLAEITRYM